MSTHNNSENTDIGDIREYVSVARKGMLCEEYAVGLLYQYFHVPYYVSPPLVTPSEEMISFIRGRRVIVYGGYYRDSMDTLLQEAEKVVVILQPEEEEKSTEIETKSGLDTIYSSPSKWTLSYLESQGCQVLEHIKLIGNYLDEYLTEYPSEETMNFQNGLYTIDKQTDMEKIKELNTTEDILQCIENGKKKRISNIRTAQIRVDQAKVYYIRDIDLSVLVTEGDSPIVDTCFLLAKSSPSGVGILFRHNYKLGRTYVSICAIERSGKSASVIARQVAKGGGSKFMGGGSWDTLIFPSEIWN